MPAGAAVGRRPCPTSSINDRGFRSEPAAAGRTSDERLSRGRLQSVSADLERTRHVPGTDPVGDRRRRRLAQCGSDRDGVDVDVVEPSRFERRLPIGDLRPRGDDDRRGGLRVAHDDHRPNPVLDDREPPAVGAIPAKLPAPDRVAYGSRRDVPSRLAQSLTEVIGERIDAGITERRILRRPSRRRSCRALGSTRTVRMGRRFRSGRLIRVRKLRPGPAVAGRRDGRCASGRSGPRCPGITPSSGRRVGAWCVRTIRRAGAGSLVASRPALSGCHYHPVGGWLLRVLRRPMILRDVPPTGPNHRHSTRAGGE